MMKLQKMVTTWAIATGLLGGLILASVSFTHPLFSVNAQSVSSTPNSTISGKAFNSLNFSDTGRPRRRGGAGSRGCEMAQGKPYLTALVPEMSAGLTLSQSPAFWFYLPYTLTSNQSIEFVLKDDQDRYIHKTELSSTEVSPGVIRLSLPSTVALEPNSNYHWYFVVHCNPQNQNRIVYANGLIRRVERPRLTQQLKSVSPQERTQLYANEGIWYDALTNLGDRLLVSPKNSQLKQDWTGLLQTVGLENLASEPFASCCSLATASQKTQSASRSSSQATPTN
jgi:hypothetical protein